MKQLSVLAFLLLLTSLLCVVFPTELPAPSATAVPVTLAPPTLLATDEPSAVPQVIVEDTTGLPPVTTSVPVVSPQPAAAHHHPGDSITLDRIKMINASNGWAVSGGDVFFTEDGAKTWREATPPEGVPPGSQVRVQGTFLDAQHAWIVYSFDDQISPNAVVWHTGDSGRTWVAGAALEHQISGQQVWAEFFALDAMHIWLMIRGVYLGAGTHYVAEFRRSTDGGLTWSPLAGNADLNNDYTGLVFLDADHGLATWQTTGMWAPGPPEYAMTSDGGVNWDVHQLPPPPDESDLFDKFYYCEPFQPYLFSDRSIRMAVGCFGGIEGPKPSRAYLYSSEDGGSTWTSMPLPEKVQIAQEPEPAAQATLFFFDKDNALLLGKDIYRSVDGGQSWEHVKSVTWTGQFTFLDPQTGWAIARANDQSALVKTSNGGAMWTELKPVIAP